VSEACLGVIGGSGLYSAPGLENARELDVSTPFGAPSDQLVEASLAGRRMLFLPRHGRGHRLAAHEVNYRANIYALKAAGAEQVVSISAVGSLREELRPGDVVVVDQYVDLTRQRANTFFEAVGVVAHVSLAEPTDAALRLALIGAAKEAGANVHERGVYLCIEGPQFSTRAESQLYRRWELDVIGMTNLPEARLAREAELPYASLCLVTDFDCWRANEKPVEVSLVIQQLRRNAALASQIVRHLVNRLPDPRASPAWRALSAGLLTPESSIDSAARSRLGVLLDRVLGESSSRD